MLFRSLELMQQDYRRAVEARMRYVRQVKGALDPKVDHVLSSHVLACEDALIKAGGNQRWWFAETWREVEAQLDAERV